jgi:hypothetical protein
MCNLIDPTVLMTVVARGELHKFVFPPSPANFLWKKHDIIIIDVIAHAGMYM